MDDEFGDFAGFNQFKAPEGNSSDTRGTELTKESSGVNMSAFSFEGGLATNGGGGLQDFADFSQFVGGGATTSGDGVHSAGGVEFEIPPLPLSPDPDNTLVVGGIPFEIPPLPDFDEDFELPSILGANPNSASNNLTADLSWSANFDTVVAGDSSKVDQQPLAGFNYPKESSSSVSGTSSAMSEKQDGVSSKLVEGKPHSEGFGEFSGFEAPALDFHAFSESGLVGDLPTKTVEPAVTEVAGDTGGFSFSEAAAAIATTIATSTTTATSTTGGNRLGNDATSGSNGVAGAVATDANNDFGAFSTAFSDSGGAANDEFSEFASSTASSGFGAVPNAGHNAIPATTAGGDDFGSFSGIPGGGDALGGFSGGFEGAAVTATMAGNGGGGFSGEGNDEFGAFSSVSTTAGELKGTALTTVAATADDGGGSAVTTTAATAADNGGGKKAAEEFGGFSSAGGDEFGRFASGPADEFGGFSSASASREDDFGGFSGTSAAGGGGGGGGDDFGEFASGDNTSEGFSAFSSAPKPPKLPSNGSTGGGGGGSLDTKKSVKDTLELCFHSLTAGSQESSPPVLPPLLEYVGQTTAGQNTASTTITEDSRNNLKLWGALQKCVDLTVPLQKFHKSFLQSSYYASLSVDPMLISRPPTLSILTGMAQFEAPLGGATALEDLRESFGFEGDMAQPSSPTSTTTTAGKQVTSPFQRGEGGAALLDLSFPLSPNSPTRDSFTLTADLAGLDLNPEPKQKKQLTSIEELLLNERLVVNRSTWMDSQLAELGGQEGGGGGGGDTQGAESSSQPNTPHTAKRATMESQLELLGLDVSKTTSVKAQQAELSLSARSVLGRLPDLSFMSLQDKLEKRMLYF